MSFVWMPFYVADYIADTGDLSTLEHGAYMLLIMHYWQKGSLPDDDDKLARIARLSPKEWGKVRPTIAALFKDGWKHKRIEEELTHAAEVSAKRRDAAQKRGKKPTSDPPKGTSKADAIAGTNDGANEEQKETQPQPPLQKKERLSAEDGATGSVVNFPAYAFDGQTIHLRRDQYDRWCAAYPNIPDMSATLETADAYYTENPPADGKWFFPVSRWLEKENAKAKISTRRAGYGVDWF